jgi:hypothetical protein
MEGVSRLRSDDLNSVGERGRLSIKRRYPSQEIASDHWTVRPTRFNALLTKVREIAAMLKAIHAGEDVAARQKVVRRGDDQ